MNSEYLTTADAVVTHQQIMTSLQISEATGRAHSHVLRDIRGLLDKGVSESNFGLSSYQQQQPNGGYKKVPMYTLTPKGCLILASGYDPVLREKIIDKLEELSAERKASQPRSLSPERKAMLEESMKQIISQYSRESEVHASLAWMQGMRDMMHLGRTAMAQMVREEGRRLGMPVPSVIPSESKELLSVTAIIKKWGLRGFKASEFNQKMIEAGAIAVRNGRKVLTGWGLDYGENRHSEHAPDVVWPVYYEDCFTYLCDRIGVDVNQLPF